MAIEGDLKDMHLTDIIQLNCRSGEEAMVSLTNGSLSGAIYFAGGQVTHATHEQEVGEEAVYRLLKWNNGHFIIEKGITSRQKTIQIPWNALLLQGLKTIDEEREASQQISEKEVQGNDNIHQILEELAHSLNGFVAAYVAGLDGTSVAGLAPDGTFDERQAVASLSHEVKQANEALALMEAGTFFETITSTKAYRFITRPVGASQYLVRIILTSEGSIGAARMYLADQEETLLSHLSTSAS